MSPYQMLEELIVRKQRGESLLPGDLMRLQLAMLAHGEADIGMCVTPKAARAALPALRERADEIQVLAGKLAAMINFQETQVLATLAALSLPQPPAASGASAVLLELDAAQMERTQALIWRLQAANPDLLLDETLIEIFKHGLACIEQQLEPMEESCKTN